MSKEIAEEYASSLADLTVNSKPLINMLTILAEENIDHAVVIVETVERHLEKVNPDIKLPVLYLIDSIIKNVGGAYATKFTQSIVNMFTRTFKQVDEKIRSQMFKLRETWHDVFPATKLYQMDVKVNLIDPAWPIQAQPQQSNIHVNPNFLKKTATTSAVPVTQEDENMRSVLAKKEQELLMLQKKKVEMELEQVRRQIVLEKTNKKAQVVVPPTASSTPVATVSPVVASDATITSIKQRLGPPVNKSVGRIAPVSAALATARRDPRLARHAPHAPPAPPAVHAPPAPIAPNVFDIKPLDRVTKRKNVITIDVRPDVTRSPRRDKRRPVPSAPPPEREDRRKQLAKDRKPDGSPDRALAGLVDKFHVADPRRINRLPPIPKINREERPDAPAPKRKKEPAREKKKKKREDAKDSSSGSSPEKRLRSKDAKRKLKEPAEPEAADELVAFKELKNYHRERYMRRNRDKSESPEKEPAAATAENESSNVPEVVLENKDVDLRVLPAVEPKPALVAQKRSSTENLEGKPKKNKTDKFDILFGNEDVDLRQLPQVDEVAAPPPPSITDSPMKSPKKDPKPTPMEDEESPMSPKGSPKKDWHEIKEKKDKEEVKKTPSKLDLVRAKLAEATKGKDRLGRPLLFSKSPSIERERRRTLSSEDTDMRAENGEEFDAEDHKKTISIIMSQAKEQFSDGQLDKNQYNALMFQVLQLNEKLKLKEAKQRESLEISKRKLKAHTREDNKVLSPKSSPSERNLFGDIDERTLPSVFLDTPPDSQGFSQDSDMRNLDGVDVKGKIGSLPLPPAMPMFGPNMPNIPNMPFPPMWRGQPRPRTEDFGPRRFRGPIPPFFRAKFDNRGPRGPFDIPRLPLPPPLPTPQLGTCQGECPLEVYERCETPPPLGAPGFDIPPTDFKIIEYIDQDPVKTIQIDGVPREIRFYGDMAIIMLDWDDPREIKFLPGCRRVTFDNKDSVVLSFNEGYKQIEIEDQVFDIRFGAPTRELYINGRWHECFFGGNPLGVIIDGKPRLVHLEGPLPQVDIGKEKRLDVVAGKINLIVNATQMCPVYLDAKVQKFVVNNQVFTIRFVDALRTVLINEQPFTVEFGDLPKPICVGEEKHFIRFSALPRNIKPGFVQIAQMEGSGIPTVPMLPVTKAETVKDETMDTDEPEEKVARPAKTPSPDVIQENQGLDLLASVMPTPMELAPGSDYRLASPAKVEDYDDSPPPRSEFYLGVESDSIPGLDSPAPPPPVNPLGSLNVTDLFAKLVASGIVQVPANKTEAKVDKAEEDKSKPREDKTVIHRVDLLKPATLRCKQPGVVAKLYGGMQCSGCGARFPPEQTVRYSQHLDWHFRQNRRERDSARRAHSRHWHYDLADWMQYEELDELDDREKNWFETTNTEEGEAPAEAPTETPSVAAGAPADCLCALCGDKFDQFYNEDKEEWHLRNSVRHEDQNYHPMCFEDYKASLTKEDASQESQDDVVAIEKPEEPTIEIKDIEDECSMDGQSDNESVVEVLDTEPEKPVEPLEIDEGEEDDVIYKAEPVEQVVVEDEVDTDDETTEKRAERDRQAEVNFNSVKVKQEPVDPDDEPEITAEEENIPTALETNHVTTLSSIDGNLQLDAPLAPISSLPLGGIRINISKSTIPTFISNNIDPMLEDISADDEPLPPGEEPELEYKLKPALEGVQFSRQPPLSKGNELSGLCSIM